MFLILNFFNLTISYSGQCFFQKPSTEIMFRIIDLHNDIMIIIISILIFVLYIIFRLFNEQWIIVNTFHIYLINLFHLASYAVSVLADFLIYITFCAIYCSFILIETIRKWYSRTYNVDLSNPQSSIFNQYYFNACNELQIWINIIEQDIMGINPFPDYIDEEELKPEHQSFNISVPFRFHHHTLLEIIWTLIPTFILTVVLFLSLGLIYAMDNIFDNSFERSALLTIKIIGNQWYWTYQTNNGFSKEEIIFDSYLDNTITIDRPLRLLQVDKEVYLPINTKIRLLITSNDVIHSWAIPSCGIKMDAIPGRINSTGIEFITLGYKIGQCSELCGTGHAFMPIVIKVVTLPEFLSIIL